MVVAVSMVKDEADVIGPTVARMLEQVDHVIVADNGSTDGTYETLVALGVQVLTDPDPAYYQSEKMTRLAQQARHAGADWVIPFDADEVWIAHGCPVKDTLMGLGPDVHVVEAELYDHVSTGRDPDDENPITRMGWRRRTPASLPKVAVRAREDLVIHQGNHGASYNGEPGIARDLLTIRHFPYRSAEQFVRKVRNGAAAYAATDLPNDMGKHWRQYGEILQTYGEDAVGDIFRTWFWAHEPAGDPELIFDPCPA